MRLTCRRQDQKVFEEIGFHPDFDESPDTPIIEMVDEEANYAHYDEMPTDVPYRGCYGAGGNYGPGSFVCDGRRYAEIETGYDGGFVVQWDEKKQKPTPQSVSSIRRYLKVRQRTQVVFAGLARATPA
jgi:hypothetical protein